MSLEAISEAGMLRVLESSIRVGVPVLLENRTRTLTLTRTLTRTLTLTLPLTLTLTRSRSTTLRATRGWRAAPPSSRACTRRIAPG